MELSLKFFLIQGRYLHSFSKHRTPEYLIYFSRRLVFLYFFSEILGELYPRMPVRISVTFVGLSVSIVYVCAIKHTLGKSDFLNFLIQKYKFSINNATIF